MKTFMKIATAAGLAGALALTAATPSLARHGRNAAAIGFGVGALAGAAAASAAYNNSYAYEPGYAYVPDYAYSYPEAGYVYAPPYVIDNSNAACATDESYGRFSYESC